MGDKFNETVFLLAVGTSATPCKSKQIPDSVAENTVAKVGLSYENKRVRQQMQ